MRSAEHAITDVQAASGGRASVYLMDLFRFLKSIFSQPSDPRKSRQVDAVSSKDPSLPRDFTADYNAATQIIKPLIDLKFPDNYHANFERNRDAATEYGAERAEAVDRASSAIAAALRKGATVKQAADAGVASAVGGLNLTSGV